MSINSEMTRSAVRSVGLITIPEEIRRTIFIMVFDGSRHTPYLSKGEKAARRGDRQDLKVRDNSAILKTCKILYHEGLSLYYRSVYYCLSMDVPGMQMRRLMNNNMRVHIRKFFGFPYKSKFGHWTQFIEHFPKLETLVFYDGFEISLPLTAYALFGPDVRPGLDLQVMSSEATKVKEIFLHRNSNQCDTEAVIRARPNLNIYGVVNFIFRNVVLNAYHTMALVDLRSGAPIKVLHSHEFCTLTEKHRVIRAQLMNSQRVASWPCHWIASRDNILDLISGDGEIERLCHDSIDRRINKLSSDVNGLFNRRPRHALFTPKHQTSLRRDHRVVTYEDYLALYKRDKWDEWEGWCPHGRPWRENCTCGQVKDEQ